jgi:ABC-type sugar transport system substrate-binding protein
MFEGISGHRPLSVHARSYAPLMVGVLVAAALAGCGSSKSSSSNTGASSSSVSSSAAASSGGSSSLSGKKVAIVSGPNSNPWDAVFNKSVQDTLQSHGASVSVQGTLDVATQIQMFNQAVSEHPTLVILEALDSNAMAAALEKAKAEGVMVVNVDGRALPAAAKGLHQVLSDNVALGRFAAENIVDGLKAQGRNSGNVAVIEGTASMLLTQDRMRGFDAVMAKNPQYKVVSVQDGNWDPVQSGTIATQLFAKYGKTGLAGVYGMADYMAIPVITAAKQAGVALGGKNGLIVSGGNCFKAGIQAIRAGTMYGTATEDPGTLAKYVGAYTVKLLSGQTVPLTETIKEARVDKADLSQYAAQCSKA